MKWWARSRLRTKIFLAFSFLILVSLLVTLWFTQLVVSAQVQDTLRRELLTTGQVFQELVQERAARLLTNSILLTSDYALKQVVHLSVENQDLQTLTSAALNYQQRIGVDLLWITDETGMLLADSLGKQNSGKMLATFSPVSQALSSGEASAAVVEIDGALFQLVAVPVLGPDVIGFLVLGQGIDDPLAQQLEKDTGSHISFLGVDDPLSQQVQKDTSTSVSVFSQGRLFASSWPQTARGALFPAGMGVPEILQRPARETFLISIAGERFLSILVPINSQLPFPLYALVQRSYDEALAPFYALHRRIAGIGGGALVIALFIGIGLAGGITSPVRTLVNGMQEVLKGNLGYRLGVNREDEIGFLAHSFNEMIGGLEEREKIRDMMRKVVSPQIAREMLQRGVTLGGEEREASVLFADIRGFTSISETLPPSELLHLLNAYLGRMSRVIEEEKGVIDKYIGDEVMALFGAPLLLEDHAIRAVAAGIGMLRELNRFNAAEGRALPLRIGIGIATGAVIAGNVGSPERLNYTVLGDTVNVASRLQGLTKEYGVPLILSGATYDRVATVFPCRSLGNVAVRGRQQETALYTVEWDRGFPNSS
ncbi:MAG: HAMP domain-containing protein [Deltaproteobacteria bacterium]|nr:HAMP domain-containing protein [Deltaproteobacteria bacterium]